MFDHFRKAATPPPPAPLPSDPLAIVTAMHELGATFVHGRCPSTAAIIWTYRAPREHAAECERLAAAISYSAFIVAIHQLPFGAIVAKPVPPLAR